MNRFQLIHCDEAARNGRLIGDEHYASARLIQARHRLDYAGEEVQFLGRFNVSRVSIHRPVTIEEYGDAGQGEVPSVECWVLSGGF